MDVILACRGRRGIGNSIWIDLDGVVVEMRLYWLLYAREEKMKGEKKGTAMA